MSPKRAAVLTAETEVARKGCKERMGAKPTPAEILTGFSHQALLHFFVFRCGTANSHFLGKKSFEPTLQCFGCLQITGMDILEHFWMPAFKLGRFIEPDLPHTLCLTKEQFQQSHPKATPKIHPHSLPALSSFLYSCLSLSSSSNLSSSSCG